MKVIDINQGKLQPDEILEHAKGELEDLIIIGCNHDGDLEVIRSHMSTERCLFLTELFQHKLLNGDYWEEE